MNPDESQEIQLESLASENQTKTRNPPVSYHWNVNHFL